MIYSWYKSALSTLKIPFARVEVHCKPRRPFSLDCVSVKPLVQLPKHMHILYVLLLQTETTSDLTLKSVNWSNHRNVHCMGLHRAC